MKHLIIPTDFSLRSLEPVRASVTHFAGEPLTVTLLHLLEPPTDIIDGLRIAYKTTDRPVPPPAFTLAVESVAAVHVGQIHAIKVKTCYGSTTAVVRNILERFGADAIVFNPTLPFEQPSRQSIDPRAVLRRAMPRCVVELSSPGRPVAAAPLPALRNQPTREAAKTRLHPALHDVAETLATPEKFSRHAS